MRLLLTFISFFIFQNFGVAQNKINWISIEKAITLSKEKPKKILMEVYTDWCIWCKKMESTTLQNKKIIDYINNNYYPVRFNAEHKNNVEFKGKTYKYIKQGKNGYHELASHLLQGKLSYPSFVYIDESLEVIQPISSYIESQKFLMIATFFNEDYYKQTPWVKFAKKYRQENIRLN